MLRCPECQPLLLDHLYGLLDAPEAAAVEAHLSTCETCQAAQSEAARARRLFAAAARSEFPNVTFTPPAPVAEPSRKESVMATSSAPSTRQRLIGWAVAATVLLAVGLLALPAVRDTVAYQIYRPTVLARMAAVDEQTAAVERATADRARAIADAQTVRLAAENRIKAAENQLRIVQEEWFAADRSALARAVTRPFQVQLSGPSTAIPGAPNTYRIQVKDEKGQPLNTEVDVAVTTTAGKELFVSKFTPDKSPDGEQIHLPAGIWSNVAADCDVVLSITSVDKKTGARGDLAESIRLYAPTYTTYLTTDKPMYRPGETVYFRSLTLDRSRFLPPANDQAVRFDILAPSGQVVDGSQSSGLTKPAVVRNGVIEPIVGPDGQPVRGVACGSHTLEAELPGGEYILRIFELQQDPTIAAKATPLAIRKFVVNNYTPDRLQKELDFDGKGYGPGAVVQAKFQVKEQATKIPDAEIIVKVTVDGEVIEPSVKPTKTDADGTAAIRFTLPKKDEVRDARVDVTVTARGITETITRKPDLATRKVNLEFFPEGGDLIAGVPNRVYFRATNSFGKITDVAGVLTDGDRELASIQTLRDDQHPGVNQGNGIFTFTPVAGKKYAVRLASPVGIVQPAIELNAPVPAGGVAQAQLGYLLPAAKAAGVVLNVPNGVSSASAPIVVNVTSTEKRNVLVGAYTRNRPIAHQSITLEAGKATEITLHPSDTKLGGVARITVFDAGNEGKAELKPLAERLVFRQPATTLKLDAITRKADGTATRAFTPGGKITLDIASKDETDKPAPAILWAAVVNESVITQADEKTARQVPTHFLISGEVRKGDDLEHADFMLTDHKLAAQSLDLLLGTQGWRRFAEQAPGQFRKTVSAEEADQLFVASIDGPVPTGWRTELKKVTNTYWPKYEAAALEFNAATQARAQLDRDTAPDSPLMKAEESIRVASQTRHTRLVEFSSVADKLVPFDVYAEKRKARLPYTLGALLGLAAIALLIRSFPCRTLPTGRRDLGIGAVALVLVAGWLCSSVLLTGRDNDAWRTLYSAAPKVTEPPTSGLPLEPEDRVVAEAAPAMAVEDRAALRLDDLAKNQGVFAKQVEMKAKIPQPIAPPAPGVGGMPFPPAGPPNAANGRMQKADQDKLAPQFRRDAKAKEQLAAGRMPRERMGKAEQNAFQRGQAIHEGLRQLEMEHVDAIRANPFHDIVSLLARERQKFLAEDKSGRAANLLVGFSDFAPRMQPLVVREYAHVNTQSDVPNATRTDFTETLLWQPVIVTPASGKASLTFALSDATAPYRVLVAGHTLDGRLGSTLASIEVRKAFSLDPKLPQEISSSDKLDVAVLGSNNTDSTLAAKCTVAVNGLRIATGAPDFNFDIPANGGSRQFVRLVPDAANGVASVTLSGTAGGSADEIKRTLKIVQDGFPANGQKSDVLEQQLTATLTLPEQIVPGTLLARATIYPNTLSEVQSGLDGLLREPSGCFEQTSTNNYPNVMILNYLNETGKAAPDVSGRAKQLIDRGYQKLISFECQDPARPERKGYEWFGGTAPPHESLTAYGLLQFTDMARIANVDPKMIERTKQYLLSRRDGKGGFQRNSRALDSFGYAPDDITNSYIVWALTETERAAAEKTNLDTEFAALSKLAQGTRAKDPYFLALLANSLVNHGKKAEGIAILKAIAGMQGKNGSVSGAETTITRSTGQDLLVETTALAVLGWLKVNETGTFRANVDPAARWMGQQRGGYGAFGGTQSTILVLKALVDYARSQKRPAENGTVRVLINNMEVAKTSFTTEQTGPIVLDIPADKLTAGKTDVRIETDAKQAYPCTLSYECRTRKPNSSAECPVELTTKLDRAKLVQGETARLDVTVKNLVAKEHGMVVAIVGIPAGLKLPEDLQQLRKMTEKPDNGREKLSYFEIRGRELILYWRGMAPDGKFDLGVDMIADHAGEFRGPASRAYLYYGSEHKHWVEPVDVVVDKK